MPREKLTAELDLTKQLHQKIKKTTQSLSQSFKLYSEKTPSKNKADGLNDLLKGLLKDVKAASQTESGRDLITAKTHDILTLAQQNQYIHPFVRKQTREVLVRLANPGSFPPEKSMDTTPENSIPVQSVTVELIPETPLDTPALAVSILPSEAEVILEPEDIEARAVLLAEPETQPITEPVTDADPAPNEIIPFYLAPTNLEGVTPAELEAYIDEGYERSDAAVDEVQLDQIQVEIDRLEAYRDMLPEAQETNTTLVPEEESEKEEQFSSIVTLNKKGIDSQENILRAYDTLEQRLYSAERSVVFEAELNGALVDIYKKSKANPAGYPVPEYAEYRAGRKTLFDFLQTVSNYPVDQLGERFTLLQQDICQNTNYLQVRNKDLHTALLAELTDYQEVFAKLPESRYAQLIQESLASLREDMNRVIRATSESVEERLAGLTRYKLAQLVTLEHAPNIHDDTVRYLSDMFTISGQNGHWYNPPKETILRMNGQQDTISIDGALKDKRKFFVASCIDTNLKQIRLQHAMELRKANYNFAYTKFEGSYRKEEIRQKVRDIENLEMYKAGGKGELSEKIAASFFQNYAQDPAFEDVIYTFSVPAYSNADTYNKEDVLAVKIKNINELFPEEIKYIQGQLVAATQIASAKYYQAGYIMQGAKKSIPETGSLSLSPEQEQLDGEIKMLDLQILQVASDLTRQTRQLTKDLLACYPVLLERTVPISGFEVDIPQEMIPKFAKEVRLQKERARKVEALIKSFGAEMEYVGVQIKSSEKYLQKHAQENDNCGLLVPQELRDIDFSAYNGPHSTPQHEQAYRNFEQAYKIAFDIG